MAISAVTVAVRAVKSGMTARAGLIAARAAGVAIRDATWFRIVGEVQRSLTNQIDEATRPLNRRPLGAEISTLTTKVATGYIQYVDVFVRDRESGAVSMRPFAVRTAPLLTRQAVIKKALNAFQTFTTGPEPSYPEQVLGAAYTATYRAVPGLAGGGGGGGGRIVGGGGVAPSGTRPTGGGITQGGLAAGSTSELSDVQLGVGDHATPAARAEIAALGPSGLSSLQSIPTAEGKVRAAAELLTIPSAPQTPIALADVRDLIGNQVSRAQVDAAITSMAASGQASLSEQVFFRGVGTDRRIAASLQIRGFTYDLISFNNP